MPAYKKADKNDVRKYILISLSNCLAVFETVVVLYPSFHIQFL